jgi:hypothetical protein
MEQRGYQLYYYATYILQFILYCHCSYKLLTNMYQFSLCFYSHKIIQ